MMGPSGHVQAHAQPALGTGMAGTVSLAIRRHLWISWARIALKQPRPCLSLTTPTWSSVATTAPPTRPSSGSRTDSAPSASSGSAGVSATSPTSHAPSPREPTGRVQLGSMNMSAAAGSAKPAEQDLPAGPPCRTSRL
jgi:hypothetical protein